MRVGVMLPMSGYGVPEGFPTWPVLRAFAQRAEDVGLDTVWVCDHLQSGRDDEPPQAIHEAWTVVSALAATTSRIEIGQLVMCTAFRDPALLAKMAVTADEVSGGRLTLGIGAGWYDAEYRAFGLPTDHRFSRFDEASSVIVDLLRGNTISRDTEYVGYRGACLLPPPARDIPVLVAGTGPRMLDLVADRADAWNTAWFREPDAELTRQIGALDAALDARGRPRNAVRRTVGVLVTRDLAVSDDAWVDELAATFTAFAAAGADDVVLSLDRSTPDSLDLVASALERR